ncbi:hypothetical protein BCEP4_880018 [Burkholderia cepacia]|nr:hypothetical protein BCEP4_880018 [Burkholderia cepacia]
MTNRKGHGQHRKTKCESYADKPDAQPRIGSRKNGRTTPSQDKPKSTNQFSSKTS